MPFIVVLESGTESMVTFGLARYTLWYNRLQRHRTQQLN